MRRAIALVLGVLALGVALAPSAGAEGTACGRSGYPDGGAFEPTAVVDEPLWTTFVAAGGFANASEGRVRVEARLVAAGGTYTATLEEVTTRDYVGTRPDEVTAVRLRVVEERAGAPAIVHEFPAVGFSGRGGGNLTLALVPAGQGVDVFWRWAYLVCDEAFPNDYYVFHAQVEGGRIVHDNTVVYFQATRPRREPPPDLFLLIVAGIAVSLIFLLAHRALRRG